MMKPNARQSEAFTRTELLVVLAVLALSTLTLLAPLNQTGGRGRTMQCLSNMRRLALASQMYANDHSASLPNGESGAGMPLPIYLASYLGVQMDERRAATNMPYLAAVCRTAPVFRCPAWPNQKMQFDYGLQYTINNIDYGQLGPMFNTYHPCNKGQKLSAMPFPLSDIAFLLELYGDPRGQLELSYGHDVHNSKHGTFDQLGSANQRPDVRMIEATDKRHGGYTTLSFMDSHVEVRALTVQELPWRIFNPKDPNNKF